AGGTGFYCFHYRSSRCRGSHRPRDSHCALPEQRNDLGGSDRYPEVVSFVSLTTDNSQLTTDSLMYRFIWLVPLLPLAGAAVNGIFGRWFRFSEKLIGGIAVGSIALSFLISVAAIYSYGFGGNAVWPNPYVSTQTAFMWIPGGAVRQTLGQIQSTTVTTANRQLTVPSPRGSLLNIE